MSTSQNGYPVLGSGTTGPLPRLRKWILNLDGESKDAPERYFVARDGSCGFLLVHMALWFDERVERLDVGVWDEWGYAVRPVRGQTSGYSNHASGTAIDINATQHPRGVPTLRTFTPDQVSRIRKRLAIYEGCLRWGGDYSGTPDGMHFEIDRGIMEVEMIARRMINTSRGEAILSINPGAKAVILS